MLPFWANSSCYPSNAGTCADTCEQGVVPTHVIKATKVSDIQAGVKFARKHNLRLIVRNTGHDFMGRSVGMFPMPLAIYDLGIVTNGESRLGRAGDQYSQAQRHQACRQVEGPR